jgi:LacI family transcriptional regulator
MKQRITIKDIARELSLSTSTVSRALADRWDVNPETRKAVLELAEKLNYKPNLLSVSLKQKQSFSVGVIVPEFINAFFPEVIMGIQAVMESEGYQLLISQSNESAEIELKNLKALEDRMVDGFIVSITKETKDMSYFRYLLENNIPVVFFNRVANHIPISRVIIDDYKWAFLSVEHLIEQGCKRIAHLKGPDNLDISHNRSKGYLDALDKYQLPYDKNLVIDCGVMMETGILGAMQLLKLPELPDGIFAINDPVAIGAMKVLKKNGIRIPEDIAIVGFTESKMAMIIEPNLTSVEQPTFEMGKAAAELLLEQIKTNCKIAQRTILLEAKLNIRESSQRVNHSSTRT